MNTILAADRLAQVKPSPSIAAKARVDALRAAGRDIIDFTIGEPDFDTPAHIVEAGVRALAAGQTRYTGSAGTPALREAVARKVARESRLDVSPSAVIVGNGAKQLIFNALSATLNPGDEVIIPSPYWVSYPDMVLLSGGHPVIAPTGVQNGFKLTPEVLALHLTPRTRWLVLNTPNNPSGAVYTAAELEALCDVLARHPRVALMSDEIYEHFVYGDARHVSPLQVAPELKDRTLIVNGVSKAYAMTGWRIGYATGPESLIKPMILLASQTTTCAAAMAQAAAAAALDGPQDCVTEARELFAARRERIVPALNAIAGLRCQAPDGAFYVFPDVSGLFGRQTPGGARLTSDVDVMTWLIEDASVASVDGTSYGVPGHLRLSFATSVGQIEAGCAAISHAVDRLV